MKRLLVITLLLLLVSFGSLAKEGPGQAAPKKVRKEKSVTQILEEARTGVRRVGTKVAKPFDEIFGIGEFKGKKRAPAKKN